MSQKCTCAASRFSPHRANKCAFRSRTREAVAAPTPVALADQQSGDNADLPEPPSTHEVDPDILNDFIFVGESSPAEPDDADEPSTAEAEQNPQFEDSPTENHGDGASEHDEEPIDTNVEFVNASSSIPEADEDVAASNAAIPNGNEQCNCVAYRLSRHRKKNCRWKKHAVLGIVVATVVAAGVVAAAVLAAKQGESEGEGTQDGDLAAGLGGINLNTAPDTAPSTNTQQAEEERRRVEREELDRAAALRDEADRTAAAAAAAEREQEERAARLRAEETQRRNMAAQQARLEAQVRENERLRAEMRMAQQQQANYNQYNATYNQQSFQVHNTNHNTYSTSTYSAPTYNMTHNNRSGSGRSQVGTTLKGTPCKNCLKQGTRCHQHR